MSVSNVPEHEKSLDQLLVGCLTQHLLVVPISLGL